MTESSPFDHVVIPRITDFQMRSEGSDITIQDVYAAISTDTTRNESIVRDLIGAVRRGRSPLLLTGRTEHLSYFEEQLSGVVSNVFVPHRNSKHKQRDESDAKVRKNQNRHDGNCHQCNASYNLPDPDSLEGSCPFLKHRTNRDRSVFVTEALHHQKLNYILRRIAPKDF